MQIKFDKETVYRTANGTARLHHDYGSFAGIQFEHFGSEQAIFWHMSDGRCMGTDARYRKFDIILPQEIVVFFVPDGDSSGWTVRHGDKSSDGMTFGEMMGLFIGLTTKSPVRELQYMKTDEQRAAEKKRSEERQAERDAERVTEETVAKIKEFDLAAFRELKNHIESMGHTFGASTDYVDFVKERLSQDHFPALQGLMRFISEQCDRAQIADSELVPGASRPKPKTPQERLELLVDLAIDGMAAKRALDDVKKLLANYDIPF